MHASNIYGLTTCLQFQLKLKEDREAKRATMDQRHHYLFSSLGAKLGMEESQVEDYMLDGDQVHKMDDFFAPNGRKCVLFYYEERKIPSADGNIQHRSLFFFSIIQMYTTLTAFK